MSRSTISMYLTTSLLVPEAAQPKIESAHMFFQENIESNLSCLDVFIKNEVAVYWRLTFAWVSGLTREVAFLSKVGFVLSRRVCG